MKTLTCKQLGGVCDLEFRAETFEEIAQQSQAHGAKMFEKGDQAHLEAMQKMQGLMQSPEKMSAWFADKRKMFDQLPKD